ncbi:MAG TPA: acyl-[acyl-carrier-protein]--UDP-N-acetylglucosamine O-acyltransferase, partial [Opitutales bacterium]|nr:acyl-[acyl-carrier-protein]--UDP-N-acetylglucosamine O-acyltransferase [Opitutales bacterium]
IGGCSKVEKDIPPFFIADGQPAYVRGVNVVGLQRANYTNEQISVIKTIYRTLYRDGLNRTQALEKLATIGDGTSREIEIIRDFAAKSSRGFASGSKVR